jgi:hypothetical protein
MVHPVLVLVVEVSLENGGTLNSSSCTCDCADIYSGEVCQTCTRTCQNGGTLNGASCTCGCSGSFTGDQCENCPLSCQNGGTLVHVTVVTSTVERSAKLVPEPVKMEVH